MQEWLAEPKEVNCELARELTMRRRSGALAERYWHAWNTLKTNRGRMKDDREGCRSG